MRSVVTMIMARVYAFLCAEASRTEGPTMQFAQVFHQFQSQFHPHGVVYPMYDVTLHLHVDVLMFQSGLISHAQTYIHAST